MISGFLQRRSDLGALFLIASSFSLGVWAQDVRPSGGCDEVKARADEVFQQCLMKIKGTALPKKVQGGVARCEKAHTNTYAKLEKRLGASCVGSQNRTEAKAQIFYAVNQQRQSAGIAQMLSPTPGTDVLAWVYPNWTEDAQAISGLFNSAQGQYNSDLIKNGYQPLVGLAVPVIAYNQNPHLNAKGINDQYCPFAQTIYTPNTYTSGLQSIKGNGGINTVIGIANIGQFDDWSQQSPQSIAQCLSSFSGIVSGLMIDDEYNRLSPDQVNAMLTWCNSQPNTAGRCGLVLGHNPNTSGQAPPINPAIMGQRQDICMDYGTDSNPNPNTPSTICLQQNPGYQRNLYQKGVPAKKTPLPFSIWTTLQ